MIKYVFLLFCYSLSIIILKFDKKEKKLNNEFNFIKDYFEDNNYYTNITIGNPNQKIKSFIRLENSDFYFSGYKYPENYNKSLSKSYKQLSEEKKFSGTEFSKGYISSDNFIFINHKNNEKIELTNITFILATRGTYFSNIQSSGIGLKIKIENTNFIYQLKKRDIIESYGFSFFFDIKNEDKGELIIGGYPHEYNNNFNGRYLKFEKSEIDNSIYSWSIKFNKISFGNFIISENDLTSFTIDYNGFIGNEIFHNFIFDNLFKNLIDKKECFKNLSEYDFKLYFYYCKSDSKVKDNFSDINFYSKVLNYTFVLNVNDVFLNVNNTIYFLVLFEKNKILNRWVLGKPFMKKYQLIFDQDKKVIGFYCNQIEKSNFFYIILIFLFIICIILILINLLIFLLKRKKITAIELEDTYVKI